ncbi:MAG: hypothetical protein EOM72_02940 [Opitutae bacterium]|nr:hypothetical protein [Opitutae bacterium]
MKKSNALLLSVLVLCAVLSPARAAEAPAVLGILEIRGLENLAGAAFELTRAAGQPMPREMVSMMLYRALGAMSGMGIQPNGKVRAVWLEGDAETGSVALLLPVENEGADYLAALGQAGWRNESETAGGIEHFIPPAGSGVAWDEVYFLKRGSTLLAGRNAEDVRTADAALATLPPILPAEGDVALQIRPAALMAAFGPKVMEQMDAAFDAPTGAPAESAAMGKLSVRGYMAAARQLEECTLGLGVADGNLNLHTRAVPVAGSTLEKWFATVRKPSAAAAVVNLPGALFVETMHLGDPNLLAPAYIQYLEELMGLMPQKPSADFMKTYAENAKTCWAQMTGDLGIALLPPTKENPLRFVEYVGLKDSAPLRALTRQMVQSVNDLMKTLSGDTRMPSPFQLDLAFGEPREYREIPVDRLTYRLTPGEPIKAMWPEGLPTELNIEMAWVPGGVLASAGEAALTDLMVDRTLDGAAAPVSDLSSWKAFYPTPEPGLVDLSHIALFDAIRSYLDLYAPGTAAEAIPAGPGHLDGASYMAIGGLMSRVRFSLADIGAIAQKAQEAQRKAMAAQMQMMQQMEDPYAFDSAPMVDEEWSEEEAEAGETEEQAPEAPPAMAE